MNDGLIHSKSSSSIASLSQFKRLQSANEKFLALQLGDSRLAGYKRSLIRLIGSNLPLSSVERPRFEILPTGIKVVENHGRTTMFSLSDIRRLTDFPEVFNRSYLSEVVGGKKNESKTKVKSSEKSPVKNVPTPSSAASNSQEEQRPVVFTVTPGSVTPGTVTPPPQEMATKINALEDELSTLRAQIALLISNQKNESSHDNSSLHLSRSDPITSSTPIKIPQPPPCTPCGAPPPGIPPPPPPPPPMMVPKKPTTDLKELIRQRKIAKGKAVGDGTTKKVSKPISMSDVLKDLHKVKLKSVERSPGGTPLGKLKDGKAEGKGPRKQEPVDSATFIQEALRKKFARVSRTRRRDSVSPDRSRDDMKEWAESPPKFGQHMLRKRNQTTPKMKKLPVPLPVKAATSPVKAATSPAKALSPMKALPLSTPAPAKEDNNTSTSPS